MFNGIMTLSPSLLRSAPFVALLLNWSGEALAIDYLERSADFAVLAGSTVMTTGVTTINGDIGVSPGTAFTVTGTLNHIGAVHIADAVAGLAWTDATNAFNALAALTPTTNLTGFDLGLVGVLTPGVYRFDTTAQLTGALTLDYASDPGGAFIFQIGSALTTASGASVITLNGSAGSGLYWNVGSAATLGSGTIFAGNILAQSAITLGPGASIVCGRAIALTGAVTMIGNTISNDCGGAGGYSIIGGDFGSSGFLGAAVAADAVPEPASWALMIVGFGLIGAAVRRRGVVPAA